MTRATQWLYGWLMLLPAAALLALFTHYPATATLWHSFLSTPRGSRPGVRVGLDNYQQLIDDPIFWQALANNLWYALGTIPLSIALANIWLFFYTPEYGLVEKVLSAFGASTHNWLGSKSTALGCLMVVAVWKEAGFFMIFYLAALQSISPHLAEA